MHHGIVHIRPGDPLCLLLPPRTSDLRTYSPLLGTSSGDHWRHFQTCSFGDLPPLPRHLVVATGIEARRVSKRVVCILECFFVSKYFSVDIVQKKIYYCPQTKLQECNVFTCFCHSVQRDAWSHFLSCPMCLLGGMMSLPVWWYGPRGVWS